MLHKPVGTRRELRDGSILEVMENPRTGVPFLVHHNMLSDSPFIKDREYVGRKDPEVIAVRASLLPEDVKGEVNW